VRAPGGAISAFNGAKCEAVAEDAIKCFLGTDMNYLVLHKTRLAKKQLHRMFAPMVKVCSEGSSLVRLAMTADVHH
jgi:hypothetical protein